ncbi:MAG TPA: hypothetical protein ENK95_03120 [Campylobacterales bacterium]|nr:hypothetical protein [Campylobacterales bacterium]
MGGFSSNYEGGYLDFDDNPKWMGKEAQKENKYAHLRQKKVYRESQGTHASYLNVLLSPSELLTQKEQEHRRELCEIDDEEIQLELEAEKEALKVYYKAVYIGYVIQKFDKENIDNTTVLKTFCVEDNEEKNLDVIWDGEGFFLRKT